MPAAATQFSIRLARWEDIPALAALIPLSVRALQAHWYSATQIEASLGTAFDVDRQLIRDGTYFVAEEQPKAPDSSIIGCGGWSRRLAVCGGDHGRSAAEGEEDEETRTLDPAHDPARIRAFFVHPAWARRGVGRAILGACEAALCAAGFHDAMLVATLAGEPLYAACGYVATERYELPLTDRLTLPVVRMTKQFAPAAFRSPAAE
ncbi:MAG: GNAT family N-acetyltransferase [Verrucomicrobia bacterium]|nr:GNAT family N-acetyltransferase [Verrucomicrobiota bacterium]